MSFSLLFSKNSSLTRSETPAVPSSQFPNYTVSVHLLPLLPTVLDKSSVLDKNLFSLTLSSLTHGGQHGRFFNRY